MSTKRTSAKCLIITDADEEVEGEELNPFSFREFLRWKNQDPDLDQDPEQDLGQEKTHSKSSSSQRAFDVGNVTFDPEVRTGFFREPFLAAEEEEDWGRSFQSGVDSTSSLCTEEEEEEEETRFSSKPEVQQRGAAGGAGGENYEGDDETSIAEPATSCRRRSGRSSQIQQLKEENMTLRRTVRELQRRSEANDCRVLELSEELLQRRRQEEKEAQDLESMVHSVEQNLQLMTKRAVRAENSVSKLKVELQQLQVEVDSLRSENDSLKAAESEVIMTMRHNAQVASEYLSKTASHAHSSIWSVSVNSQLLREAETLRLVSQLLQSIDKISNLNSES
ncbi:endosome-associated-trafficking regulator 1 isoform X2 [Chelmon rostratus]|uniref:endosome-associated-trafficking regulator 1 isoform X2 n=1 Tax=Chelmon rostratus TaxID=109905 RepID=UPI001BE9E2A6|nr:endosome-associated-trafficking regulator 1 isoform X2 [Chelmon rostratus]